MADTDLATVQDAALPVVVADPAEIARISDSINITDRAGISVYGDRAQQAVSDYADRILREVRNKDLGDVGRLLTDIILKSKSLDPA
ncbi:toxic anion resistance protein, partial [Rhizobium sp. PEPV16]|uniref:toxic anion resistance protein n=1 Tax=Rhizobium sp. PEPV16 TaxID=1820614 RepID=UPI0015E1B9C5